MYYPTGTTLIARKGYFGEPMGGILDTIGGVIKSVVTGAKGVYDTSQQTAGQNTLLQQQLTAQQQLAAGVSPPMSTTTKILLGAGAAVALGAVIVLVKRKK